MVKHLEREMGKMAGEKEMWMKEVKEDREAWSGFRASHVNLAEQKLETEDGEGGGHIEEGEDQDGGVYVEYTIGEEG